MRLPTWAVGFWCAQAWGHLPHLVLVVIGVGWAIRKRGREAWLPVSWLVASLLALSWHRPVWPHLLLVPLIPTCWLGAYGVDACLAACQRLGAGAAGGGRAVAAKGAAAALVLLLVLGVWYCPRPLHQRLARGGGYRLASRPELVQQLTQDARRRRARWIFTDRPFYAFKAGLAVPPPVAVMSEKRLAGGWLSGQQIVDTLRTYRPSYVLLERFTSWYPPLFWAEVNDSYELMFQDGSCVCYRRRMSDENLSADRNSVP